MRAPATSSSSRGVVLADRVVRIVVAVVLLQTLRFKFTGAPESVHIFETVGMEPWGRYGSGVVELIASVLLFVPGCVAFGALLALGTMAGAIFFHFTSLGIEVQGDGGVLFAAALGVFAGAAFVLWNHRRGLPVVGRRL